jgi:hypothetical protein
MVIARKCQGPTSSIFANSQKSSSNCYGALNFIAIMIVVKDIHNLVEIMVD